MTGQLGSNVPWARELVVRRADSLVWIRCRRIAQKLAETDVIRKEVMVVGTLTVTKRISLESLMKTGLSSRIERCGFCWV